MEPTEVYSQYVVIFSKYRRRIELHTLTSWEETWLCRTDEMSILTRLERRSHTSVSSWKPNGVPRCLLQDSHLHNLSLSFFLVYPALLRANYWNKTCAHQIPFAWPFHKSNQLCHISCSVHVVFGLDLPMFLPHDKTCIYTQKMSRSEPHCTIWTEPIHSVPKTCSTIRRSNFEVSVSASAEVAIDDVKTNEVL